MRPFPFLTKPTLVLILAGAQAALAAQIHTTRAPETQVAIWRSMQTPRRSHASDRASETGASCVGWLRNLARSETGCGSNRRSWARRGAAPATTATVAIYINTLSWRTPTTPLPMEINPRVVCERLFGDGGTPEERLARIQQNRSVLDAVTQQAKRLNLRLGAPDRNALNDYLENVR